MSTLRLGVFLFVSAAILGVLANARSQSAPASDTPNPAMVQDLVYANRILADQGLLDSLGHISVRDDKNPARFWMSRMTPADMVTSKDILEFDLQGAPIDPTGSRIYLERFIHAAIYRARPDVKAVVHSHAPSTIPFGVTGTNLRPIINMAVFLGAGAPIFEIRDAASGPAEYLITNNKLGDALARSVGDHTVVLIRGHGMAVVGDSIQQVVIRTVYTDVNAKLQAEAMALGKVNFITMEEAAAIAKDPTSQSTRPWDSWKAKVGKIE